MSSSLLKSPAELEIGGGSYWKPNETLIQETVLVSPHAELGATSPKELNETTRSPEVKEVEETGNDQKVALVPERWNDKEGLEWESLAEKTIRNFQFELAEAKKEDRFKDAKDIKSKIAQAQEKLKAKFDLDYELERLNKEKLEAAEMEDFSRAQNLVQSINAVTQKRKKIISVQLADVFAKPKKKGWKWWIGKDKRSQEAKTPTNKKEELKMDTAQDKASTLGSKEENSVPIKDFGARGSNLNRTTVDVDAGDQISGEGDKIERLTGNSNEKDIKKKATVTLRPDNNLHEVDDEVQEIVEDDVQEFNDDEGEHVAEGEVLGVVQNEVRGFSASNSGIPPTIIQAEGVVQDEARGIIDPQGVGSHTVIREFETPEKDSSNISLFSKPSRQIDKDRFDDKEKEEEKQKVQVHQTAPEQNGQGSNTEEMIEEDIVEEEINEDGNHGNDNNTDEVQTIENADNVKTIETAVAKNPDEGEPKTEPKKPSVPFFLPGVQVEADQKSEADQKMGSDQKNSEKKGVGAKEGEKKDNKEPQASSEQKFFIPGAGEGTETNSGVKTGTSNEEHKEDSEAKEDLINTNNFLQTGSFLPKVGEDGELVQEGTIQEETFRDEVTEKKKGYGKPPPTESTEGEVKVSKPPLAPTADLSNGGVRKKPLVPSFNDFSAKEPKAPEKQPKIFQDTKHDTDQPSHSKEGDVPTRSDTKKTLPQNPNSEDLKDDTSVGGTSVGSAGTQGLQIQDLTEDEMAVLMEQFRNFDVDGNGHIDDEEVLVALSELGYGYHHDYNDTFIDIFCEGMKEEGIESKMIAEGGRMKLTFQDFRTFIMVYKAYHDRNCIRFAQELKKYGFDANEENMMLLEELVDLKSTVEDDPEPIYDRVVEFLERQQQQEAEEEDVNEDQETGDSKEIQETKDEASKDENGKDTDIPFAIGSRALGNFRKSGRWYPCTVIARSPDGTFTVQYKDGDEEHGLTEEDLKEDLAGETKQPDESVEENKRNFENETREKEEPASKPMQRTEGKDSKSNLKEMQHRYASVRKKNRRASIFGEEDLCQELEMAEIDGLRQAFDAILNMYDSDGNRTLGLEEFKVATRAMGLDPSEGSVEDLFRQADKDGNGELGFEEFTQYALRIISDHMKKDLEIDTIRSIISTYTGGKGYFTQFELKEGLIDIGLDPKIARGFFRIMDKNGDGQVDVEEFMETVTDGTPRANLLLRSLMKCILPSPSAYLLNVQGMPSTYRLSALKRYDLRRKNSLSHRLHPRLEPSGMCWEDFALDPKTAGGPERGMLLPNPLPPGTLSPEEQKKVVDKWDLKTLNFEMLQADGIPIPGDDRMRKRIVARRARVCILDENEPTSNIHTVKVRWNPREEDVWRFQPKDSRKSNYWNNIVVRSIRPGAFVLIELSVLVRPLPGQYARTPRWAESKDGRGLKSPDSGQKRTVSLISRKPLIKAAYSAENEEYIHTEDCYEMACGFALLKLDDESCNRKQTLKLKVHGGTFFSMEKIKREDIIARRKGLRALMRRLNGHVVQPTLKVKVQPASYMPKLYRKELLPRLPREIVVTTQSLRVIRMYYELAADRILAHHQPLEYFYNQDISLRVLLKIFDQADALQVLSEIWIAEVKKIPSRQSKKLKTGAVNDYVKKRFRSIVKRFVPVLSLYQLPQLIVGVTDHQRTQLLRSYGQREDTGDILLQDGISRGTHMYAPFNTKSVFYGLEIDDDDMVYF